MAVMFPQLGRRGYQRLDRCSVGACNRWGQVLPRSAKRVGEDELVSSNASPLSVFGHLQQIGDVHS